MKKNSLLFVATLIFTTVIKGENNAIAYSLFATQATGALYAITGIRGLLAAETPTNKELSPKKALEIRIKKAADENKVWTGISVFLIGYLAQAAAGFVVGVNAGLKASNETPRK